MFWTFESFDLHLFVCFCLLSLLHHSGSGLGDSMRRFGTHSGALKPSGVSLVSPTTQHLWGDCFGSMILFVTVVLCALPILWLPYTEKENQKESNQTDLFLWEADWSIKYPSSSRERLTPTDGLSALNGWMVGTSVTTWLANMLLKVERQVHCCLSLSWSTVLGSMACRDSV